MSAPPPPPDLASRDPDFVALDKGTLLHRFYTLQSGVTRHDPINFDTGNGGRLNAPTGLYGVLYCAETVEGAFAETFLRVPGRTLLPADLVKNKGYVELKTSRQLRLLKLGGAGLAKIGATAEVTHGGLPYDVPQSWSRAIHGLRRRPDGIAYYARHDDEQLCYAIFGPLPRSVVERRRIEALDNDWFWALSEHYNVGLAPRGLATP